MRSGLDDGRRQNRAGGKMHPIDREQMMREWLQGYTSASLGRKYGIGADAARGLARQRGLTRTRSGLTAAPMTRGVPSLASVRFLA